MKSDNMKKVALISCTKLKKSHSCKARELYSESELFKLSYIYAKEIADEVYILSAKYGLLHENDIINPYEKTLKNEDMHFRRMWADSILFNLSKKYDLINDKFYIFAGKDYYENLVGELKNVELPLGTLRYGERISFLQGKVNSYNHPICKVEEVYENGVCNSDIFKLHELINQLPRYKKEGINSIPFEDGVYFFFEEGERYKGLDRIVRVGSHRASGRLKGRLRDHYKPNKDGSIFRKNIGRAILNYDKDTYLDIWEINFSKCDSRVYHIRDKEKEKVLEERITKYLDDKFSFACIKIEDKEERLRFEDGIIALLNKTEDFQPSNRWSGRFSPYEEIRKSGLWLKEGLNSIPLSSSEIEKLVSIIKHSYINADIERDDEYYNIDGIVENTELKNNTLKSSAATIRKFIEKELDEGIIYGKEFVQLKSGDINKALNFIPHKNSQISQIMWEFYDKEWDEIIYTTESGKSSTIEIKYCLKNR